MKLKLLPMILSGLFMHAAIATPMNPAPNACPSLADIKTQGIQFVSRDSTWGWMGFTNNLQYNTNVKWTFGMFIQGEINDEQQAINLANAQLSTLNQVQGPLFNNDNGNDQWFCLYNGINDQIALAMTPPFVGQMVSFAGKFKH